jgi:ribosome-binding protein aMBF1 (putative translation factor)
MTLNRTALRVELARRDLKQADLAQMIGKAPTTFSGWITGRHAPPDNLVVILEKTLKLPRGTLATK